jgi:hypothetical protein
VSTTHAAITNDDAAAAGANSVALLTKAGHANMATTKRYLHLAGVVFRDEADRLEARLLGETVAESVPPIDTHLVEPKTT